jgi:ammonium transporter, Amt family
MNSGDTAWLLTATTLVLFMTLPGLAAFYGGLVRTKNVLSVLMQCFAITCVVSVLWFAGAYGLIFGDGGAYQPFIGSLAKAMFATVGRNTLSGTTPEIAYSMFQLTFAIITPALMIGALAERTRFSALLLFSTFWFLLVYVPVCHWIWGGGWLAKRGVLDFAGGLVVHVNAGAAALVAALYIGRRRGFPHVAMPPHSMPLTVLGAGMLWVGWFGFNAGSALTASGSAAMTMWVTHLGASTGALTWMILVNPVVWASSPAWWPDSAPSRLPPASWGRAGRC